MRHLSVYPDLTTYAVPLPDGSYNSDRNGNPKITRVTLEPEGFPIPHRPEGLTDSQWAFATSGPAAGLGASSAARRRASFPWAARRAARWLLYSSRAACRSG